MRTRHAALRRFVGLVLALALGVSPAFGQADATIQRLAEITTQLAEIEFLYDSYQITGEVRNERRAPLIAEAGPLNLELRKLSPEERRRADEQIQALTRARLATLRPQWQKQAEDL